ncbi:ABC transporter substrate-binding protein [Actinophytocola sediminis]
MVPSNPMTRRALLLTTAVALVAAGACAAPKSAGGGGADTLVIAKTDAGTTYPRNFNVVGPATQKTPGASLIYEPLVRTDYSDGATTKPWLAEKWAFADGGATLNFTLRQGVTFSDGKPLTVDDVLFSLSLPIEQPQFNIAGVTYESVAKVDDRTVAVHFAQPAYSELNQFANPQLPVVPKHIWAAQDLNTWTNPDPVGTGPVTLATFSAQQVTLATRADYWGGAPKMKTVKIIPTSQDAVKAQLLRGEVDWAATSWPGADKEYVAVDPEHHQYQQYATGRAYALVFNAARAPFDDPDLRRALSLAIPRTDIVATLNRPGTEAGPTGLAEQVYGDWLKSDYRGTDPAVDLTGARKALADGGFTVQDGALVKDGRSFTPTLSFNQDYGWGAYADIIVSSWQQTFGLTVKTVGVPSVNLYEQQQLGEFDLTVAEIGGPGVFATYAGFNSVYRKPLGQKAPANFGRFDNGDLDAAIQAMASTDDQAKLKDLAQDAQTVVVEQVPFAPIYNSYWFININSTRWGGWPAPDDFDRVPFPDLGPDATRTLLGLTPTGAK